MSLLADAWLILSAILLPLFLVLCVGSLLVCSLKSVVKSLLVHQDHKVHTITTGLADESYDSSRHDRSLTSRHLSRNVNTSLPVISAPGMVTKEESVGDENELERSYGPVIEVHKGIRSLMHSGVESGVEPVYYPQRNCSESRPLHMSPMAPLQPPWPHLPPLGGARGGDQLDQQRRMPTPLRNFFIHND